jgi:hypothetical protein
VYADFGRSSGGGGGEVGVQFDGCVGIVRFGEMALVGGGSAVFGGRRFDRCARVGGQDRGFDLVRGVNREGCFVVMARTGLSRAGEPPDNQRLHVFASNSAHCAQ